VRKKSVTDRPSLPTGRAFVVQLHAEADIALRRLHGRVEHIVSGEATRFASVKELVTFMVELLAKLEQEESRAD
jgi:hypothetical protein